MSVQMEERKQDSDWNMKMEEGKEYSTRSIRWAWQRTENLFGVSIFFITWSGGNSVAVNFSSNKNEVLKWFHKMTQIIYS